MAPGGQRDRVRARALILCRDAETKGAGGPPRLAPTNMKITVDTLGGQFSFECAPTERILYAALCHGLRVPYECATGTCGTCRGRVTLGGVDVQWDAAPGFARLKREK